MSIRLGRREFLTLAGAAAVSGCDMADIGRRPNILVLITGGQRWDGIRAAGNSVVETPHLDTLVSDGVVFANAFATSATAMASRASIMTGLYERRHGCNYTTADLSTDFFAHSYPVLLREAGYRTGFAGGLGFAVTDRPRPVPGAYGDAWLDPSYLPASSFDDWRGFAGPGDYFPQGTGGPHMTAMLAESTAAFLKSCSPDTPWCLTVGFKAPRAPFESDPVYRKKYENTDIPLPLTASIYFYDILPECVKISYANRGADGDGYFAARYGTRELFQDSLEQYYCLITGIDDAVGRIRTSLETTGFAENTVIIFVSDTGELQGEHYLGGNVLLYEESVRIPLIVFDPRQKTAPEEHVRRELSANIDIAPTIFDLAGIRSTRHVHGSSLRPLMRGRPGGWRQDILLENRFSPALTSAGPVYYPHCEAVRTERWKYIRYSNVNPAAEELFDLPKDYGEAMNYASDLEHRGTLVYLRNRREALLEEASSSE